MAVIFGILSALSFGIGDFLARFSSQEIGHRNSLFWMFVVGVSFYYTVFIFVGNVLVLYCDDFVVFVEL